MSSLKKAFLSIFTRRPYGPRNISCELVNSTVDSIDDAENDNLHFIIHLISTIYLLKCSEVQKKSSVLTDQWTNRQSASNLKQASYFTGDASTRGPHEIRGQSKKSESWSVHLLIVDFCCSFIQSS